MLLLAMAIIAVSGIAAQQALAYGSYEHSSASSCSSCHPGGDTSIKPTNANCASCHTNYVTLVSGKTCWTCHLPGQAMGTVKTGAPGTCTSLCHLANSTDNTHNPHPTRGVCTTCHPLTTSFSNPNNSPHHTLTAPGSAIINSFVPASGAVGATTTITGFGFTGATLVTFNGTSAPTFTVDSNTQITATVPVGATTGKIAVTPLSGPVVTSLTDFTVTTVAVKTTISLKVAPTSIKLKKSVKATGAVTPVLELTGTKVTFKAEMKKGSKWVKTKTGSANVLVTGKYSWTYKPAKKGSYRITATVAATSAHLGSHATKTFKVK
jgi:hypothetical protein